MLRAAAQGPAARLLAAPPAPARKGPALAGTGRKQRPEPRQVPAEAGDPPGWRPGSGWES